MGKHTPGPWHVTDVSGNEGEAEIIEAKHRGIAWTNDSWDEMKQQGYISQEDKANARLIAAAPDLFAALRDLITGLPEEYDDKWTKDLVEKGKRAIAKAKGGG